MTTVAWDGYDLAADGQISRSYGTVGYKYQKIRRLKNGGYTAGAGTACISKLVADWLDGLREPPSNEAMKDSEVIYIDPKGQAWLYSDTCEYADPSEDLEAFGSGGKFAFAIMVNGGTAEEAVKVACKIDPDSGGKITVVHVNPRKEKKIGKSKNTLP